MRLCIVEWVDSRGVSDQWTLMEELNKRDACIVKSVGWIIEHTDWITIIPHLGDDPYQGCGEMTIPRIAIKTIHGLNSDEESKVSTE